MASAVDVKVIYSAVKRRGSSVARVDPGEAPASKLIVLGLLNIAVACGLYYATWWNAEPELRLKILMHTPLAGVDLDGIGQLMATATSAEPKPASATGIKLTTTEEVASAQAMQAARFVGTMLGWVCLSTLSICALALSGGRCLADAHRPRLRRTAIRVSLAGLAVVACASLLLWINYGHFEPKQLRTYMGGVVISATLLGLFFRWGGWKFTTLAAALLIGAAVASAYTLYVLVQFGAVETNDLPLSLTSCALIAFVIHSFWGWVLLLVGRRVST